MARIGLMGGTFNPIHNGHIAVAEAAQKQAQLEQIIFLPSGTPPHKHTADTISREHRLNMVQLAVEGHPGFQVSDYEIRSGRVNYTAETLQYFLTRYPADTFYFIIGADSFRDLPLWKDYTSILQMVTLIVVSRPGIDKTALLSRFRGDEPAPHMLFIPNVQQEVSSSMLRAYARDGKCLTPYLPAGVAHYIQQHGLYR